MACVNTYDGILCLSTSELYKFFNPILSKILKISGMQGHSDANAIIRELEKYQNPLLVLIVDKSSIFILRQERIAKFLPPMSNFEEINERIKLGENIFKFYSVGKINVLFIAGETLKNSEIVERIKLCLKDADIIANYKREHIASNFAYPLKAIVKLFAPFNIESMNDEFQCAKILEEKDREAKLEVILRPNIHIKINPKKLDSISYPESFRDYLKPGYYSGYNDEMREYFLNFREECSTDYELLRKILQWISQNIHRETEGEVPMGYRIVISDVPLPKEVKGLKIKGKYLKIEYPRRDNKDREYINKFWFAENMFKNRVLGDCTSSAVFLTGVLRAAGLPVRMAKMIPLNTNNLSAHTINEVYVGGKWIRVDISGMGDTKDAIKLSSKYFYDRKLVKLESYANLEDVQESHVNTYGEFWIKEGRNPYELMELKVLY